MNPYFDVNVLSDLTRTTPTRGANYNFQDQFPEVF